MKGWWRRLCEKNTKIFAALGPQYTFSGLFLWAWFALTQGERRRDNLQPPTSSLLKPTIRLTPQAWSLAEQYGLRLEELASVTGSGEDGRITEGDLHHYLEMRGLVTPAPAPETPSTLG